MPLPPEEPNRVDGEEPQREPPGHPPPQHLSTLRLFTVIVLFLGLAGYLVWKSERFQNLVHGVSQARLSEALGVAVSFDTVELSIFPPALRAVNVRVANDPGLGLPPDRPLLTAEEVSVGGGSSLSEGQLRLGRIRAVRPQLFLQQLPDGRWNLPPGLSGPSKKGGMQVKVGSLLVLEGVLDFNGRRIGIDGRLEDFAAELTSIGPERYRGALVARRVALRLPSAEPLVAALGLRFTLDGQRGATVDDLRLQGPFGKLIAWGTLEDPGDPHAGLLVSAAVSIEEVERVFRSSLGFEGEASVRARLEFPRRGGFRITGTVRAPRARRPPFLLQDVSATVVARPEGLVARIERARYAGGEAQGTFRIADLVGAQLPMTLAVQAEGIALEGFFADLDLPGTGLSGMAGLDIALRWGEGGIERANGGGRLEIRPGPPVSQVRGRFGIPTEGGGALAVVRGRIGFEQCSLKLPHSTIDFSGGIPIGDWRPDFDFRLRSRDFSETDRIFQNFVAASGGKPEPLGLGGSGEVAGHLERSWSNPTATAQITAEDAAYAGVVFGSARGTVDMADGAFLFRPLRVYEGDASLSLEGMAAYRTMPGRAPLDLSVSTHRFPISRLLRYLDLSFPIEGRVTGTFPLQGSKEALTGGGAAELTEAVLWGQPFARITGRSVLTPGRFTLEEVRAPLGDGMLGGRGSYAFSEKRFEARLAGDGISLGAIEAVRSQSRELEGKLSFELTGSGTLDRPDLTVTASLAQASFFHHEIPAANEPSLSVRIEQGQMEGELSVPSGFRLAASGEVFPSGSPLDLSLDVSSLPELLRYLPMDLPEGYGGSLAVAGKLTLAAGREKLPSGKFQITRAVVDLPGKPGALSVKDEVGLALEGGRVTLDPFEISGEGTSLSARGSLQISPPGDLDLSVSGPLDPALLAAVMPELPFTGRFQVALSASGSVSRPALSGELKLENGRYRLPAVSQFADDIEATVRLAGAAGGQVEGRARIGGGEVSVAGQFDLDGVSLKSFRLTLQGRRITVRYPEDVRLQLDADLVASGSAAGNTVRGEIVLLRGTYSRDFDVALTDLLARSRPSGAAAREPWKEKTRLDIHVASSESLEVRNNLAALTGTVDLVARGTLADPMLIGQVVLDEGGRVTFRDVRYDIESGTLTFASARGLVPILDVRARAEVRGYDLVVNLAGSWPRVETTFSSDPPLSDEQIVNLLLTGSRPSQGPTQEVSATLASTAGSIVGGAATGVLTRPAQKLFKLERFEIEPIFTASGLSGATTTVGKQINPNWSVTYSQPLFEAGIKQPIVEIEGRISQSWVLRLRKDENGNYLLDFRRRTRS
ncbi:MAG TPA: translocation/assembly module TamB domain-containing protein [Thermoanaerobaculia bacterium]|nr:translocation/assembly module TamB domain-containing protein [Thermoanaerobaculia bacterium]